MFVFDWFAAVAGNLEPMLYCSERRKADFVVLVDFLVLVVSSGLFAQKDSRLVWFLFHFAYLQIRENI